VGVREHDRESHAFGVSIGVGFAAVYVSRLGLVGAAAGVAWAAVRSRRPSPVSEQDVFVEIRREPQYFLAGIVAGAVVGFMIRMFGRR